VVIPQRVRESLGLVAGEKLRVLSFAGRVELVPVRGMRSLRGFLKGMDTSIERERDRA
jgi:AbrB family looped-hinge helix DNA binding protein